MKKYKITTLEDLESSMKARNAALKSVQPVCADEQFTFITHRRSPNQSVDPTVAKEFIEKYEKTDKMKVIGWNSTSTTIYVLR